MKRENDHRTVRELFEGARQEESGASPEFSTVWRAAERRRRTTRSSRPSRRERWLLATATVALVTIVIAIAYYGSRPPVEPPWPFSSLTSWEAPTDFLLETPGSDLLRTLPELTPELPGYAREADSNQETEPPARRTES